MGIIELDGEKLSRIIADKNINKNKREKIMSILIKNIDLLTMARDVEVVTNTNIYIKENKIEYIGDLRDDIDVDRVIDGKNKLAMPGLINAHTHMGMSLIRNYADDLPLHEWLNDRIWPIEAKMTGKDIYWGTLLSTVEMIQSGTTTFCDMYVEMDDVAKATEESGMRAVLTRGTIEPQENLEKTLDETRQLYKNWHKKANGRITVMVAPHAPNTCGDDFLLKMMDLADELNTGINIHVSETKKEIEDSYDQYGKSPVQRLNDLGLFNHHTIAAHCVHVGDEDIDILYDYGFDAFFSIMQGVSDLDEALKKGAINIEKTCENIARLIKISL